VGNFNQIASTRRQSAKRLLSNSIRGSADRLIVDCHLLRSGAYPPMHAQNDLAERDCSARVDALVTRAVAGALD
jgi:hypothetical protein